VISAISPSPGVVARRDRAPFRDEVLEERELRAADGRLDVVEAQVVADGDMRVLVAPAVVPKEADPRRDRGSSVVTILRLRRR
jgi:hypothetical protein